VTTTAIYHVVSDVRQCTGYS